MANRMDRPTRRVSPRIHRHNRRLGAALPNERRRMSSLTCRFHRDKGGRVWRIDATRISSPIFRYARLCDQPAIFQRRPRGPRWRQVFRRPAGKAVSGLWRALDFASVPPARRQGRVLSQFAVSGCGAEVATRLRDLLGGRFGPIIHAPTRKPSHQPLHLPARVMNITGNVPRRGVRLSGCSFQSFNSGIHAVEQDQAGNAAPPPSTRQPARNGEISTPPAPARGPTTARLAGRHIVHQQDFCAVQD